MINTRKIQKLLFYHPIDWYLWVIIQLTVMVTVLHYITPTHYHYLHELYRRVYYLPIIIAAYRYGLGGGITTALVIVIIYLPHVIFQWRGTFLDNLVRFNEIILYVIIGAIAGYLSRKVQREKERYKTAAEELEYSLEKQREQNVQLSELESQLRAADRFAVLGELSASLAHELRNPMGSIRGAADILKKHCQQDDVVREFSELLSTEVERLNQVMENYLDIARKPLARAEQTDIVKVIESVVALIGPQVQKKAVRLSVDLPTQKLLTNMKEVEVRQVFLNLVINALEANTEGGTITISGERRDNNIFIKVSDTGKGISRDVLSKIFLPFYTSRKNGTGLGLAIVKRIMESAQGSISVESEENKGASFLLTFNRAK